MGVRQGGDAPIDHKGTFRKSFDQRVDARVVEWGHGAILGRGEAIQVAFSSVQDDGADGWEASNLLEEMAEVFVPMMWWGGEGDE